MPKIHPTAIVSEAAVIGENVEIGPYSVIEGPVHLGANSVVKSHVALAGNTHIAEGAKIFPFASVGHQPQDLKFTGEETRLIIGKNCTIREGVTVNPGTSGGISETRIGDDCALLANSHVAHDCIVGNNVILSNGVLLAGHVTLGDFVIMGGASAVHQFTRIGDHAFIGGLAGVENDVIPFGLALGNRAYLGGVNLIGMKRFNYPRESIHAVRQVYRALFETEEGTMMGRVEALDPELKQDILVARILDFVTAQTDRSFCTPRQGRS
ncbi:MAG: acyl-ACP--UDP-N-acetylglucosamine O-acyltransferase [Pseudomonadota bacterium]